jgi:type 1 fimbriae regulatory protein FimB/type 1 fimbriae regulatory protein FimE
LAEFRKPKSDDVRSRPYLTPSEVARLATAAGRVGRHRHRDKHLILMMYMHGLRVSEAVKLKRDQLDLVAADIHVKRRKGGKTGTHPLTGDELRALRKLLRDYPDSPYVFSSERHGPLTCSAVAKMIARAGVRAKIGFPVNPHALRHACGYKLANDGRDTRAIQDYLGHRNIKNTEIYTELASDRFKEFFED